MTKVIFPDETPYSLGDNPYATLEYNDTDNSITITDENGGKTVERSDWANRLVEADQYCTFDNTTNIYNWNFYYDSLGNKVQQSDPRGNTVNKFYDEFGRLTHILLPVAWVTFPDGSSTDRSPMVTNIYDLKGNKIKEISPNGNGNENSNYKTEYEYDQLGRVIQTTVRATDRIGGNPVPTITRYIYDQAGNKVKTIIDAGGKNLTYEYNYSAQGFLIAETDPLGRTTRYRYDALGNKVAVIDPRNTAVGLTEFQKLKCFSYQRLSDTEVNYIESYPMADKTFTTWYQYDELNRLIRTVLPTLPGKDAPANPFAAALDRVAYPYTEIAYDLVGNQVKISDAQGVAVSYEYTPRNQVAREIDNSGVEQRVYTYDKKGLPIAVKDAMGHTARNQYDSLGRLRVATDPSGYKQYLDYDGTGNKTGVTDARGNTALYYYNSLGWLTGVRDPLGNIARYEYDANGNRIRMTAPNNLVTTYKYDELNRLTERIDSLYNSTQFNYDAVGNLNKKVDPRQSVWEYLYFNDNLLKQLKVTGNPSGEEYLVSYTYDAAGNRNTVTDSYKISAAIYSNNTVKFNYNGSGVYTADPQNRINRIDRQFDGAAYTTKYEYGANGLLTGIDYPEALAKLEYKYNNLNQLSEVAGFTAASNGIVYNPDGTLKSLTYLNGAGVTYNYDPNNRLDNFTVTAGGTEVLKQEYDYDGNGNIIRMNDRIYQYDKNNQLISAYTPDKFMESQPTPGTAGIRLHDQLGDGRLEFGVNQQAIVKLDYASTTIGLDFGTVAPSVKKIVLKPAANYKNHRVNDNTFDLFFSVDNLIYTPVPRGDWDYAKDTGTGEIGITFKQASAIRYLKIHFKHDERDPFFLPAEKATFLNELAKTVQVYQEATSQTEEYQYDAAGNRTLVKMTLAHTDLYQSEYYPNSDRLKTDGKYTYTYDNAGNMTAKSGNGESWAYRYDLLNRLIEVKKNDTIIVNYKYDPSGLRVVRAKPGGAKTHYVFEGTEVIFEKNISNNTIKSYVYAFGKHLARVDGKIGDTAAPKYFYHTDHLGSVKAVTDQSGTVVYKADFFAFGKQYDKENAATFNETHGFNGKEYDEDTGLYYYNARWYDAETGRFVSEDPAGDPNSPNLYSYCGNNPLGHIDPTGLDLSDFADAIEENWDDILEAYWDDYSSSDDSSSYDDYIDSHIQEVMNYFNDIAQRLDDSIDRDRISGIGGFGDSGDSGDSCSWDNISKAIEEVFSHTSGYGDTNGDGYGPGIGSFGGGIGSNIRDVIGSIIGYGAKIDEKLNDAKKRGDLVTQIKIYEKKFPGFKYNFNSKLTLEQQLDKWIKSRSDAEFKTIKTNLKKEWENTFGKINLTSVFNGISNLKIGVDMIAVGTIFVLIPDCTATKVGAAACYVGGTFYGTVGIVDILAGLTGNKGPSESYVGNYFDALSTTFNNSFGGLGK